VLQFSDDGRWVWDAEAEQWVAVPVPPRRPTSTPLWQSNLQIATMVAATVAALCSACLAWALISAANSFR